MAAVDRRRQNVTPAAFHPHALEGLPEHFREALETVAHDPCRTIYEVGQRRIGNSFLFSAQNDEAVFTFRLFQKMI